MAEGDLEGWLGRIGLDGHASLFRENDVDLETLRHLSDADLKDLGLSLGHRRKLMAALRESAPAPEPAAARTDTEQAERRQLTVLFCDLAGSTELSQALDPEVLREVMRRYHEAVAGAVTTHGGHVAKLLGDGVLAYFGWPRAHEAQAEGAVRAALSAVAAVGAIRADGAPLAARAGIATGPVVIGDIEGPSTRERGAVAGATPNLAARLQDVARPGEVVIHAVTRRLIGGSFQLEDAGAHRLKGFPQPVPVWRVRGAAPGSRFDALHGAALTEFVGRAQEVGLLADRWRRAGQGEGQVVLVSGEAGIGKSRVLREFVAGLLEEDAVLRFQCSPHETNTAFHPLISEIETSAGFQPEDSPEQRLDRLEAHLSGIPGIMAEQAGRSEGLPLIAALLGLPVERYPRLDMAPQRRKQRTVALLAERLLAIAAHAPRVLLIEDVHWIDPSSLEVLDALVPALLDRPVLAVLTTRPGFAGTWLEDGHVTVLSLNRLGRREGRAIAERVAGGKALPDPVLNHVVEQTDGIPLFVEELTKAVLESDVLEERADRYVLSGPLPTLALPTTLQDSLMARLDRLAPVRPVVQAAACIGREFDAGLLAQGLPMERADLDDALGQLLAAQLIFRRGGAEKARYVFKHALVQDAAYSSLLLSARRALHRRLALALERDEGAEPLELARHFAGAGEHDRAATLYLEAGRHALSASALPEAIGALEFGLQQTAAMPTSTGRDRCELDLRVALGAARMACFGWAHRSVSEALEPAFPLARAFRDPGALGSILWGLWVHYQTRTQFGRAHDWLAKLEAAAGEHPESDLPVIFDMSAGCQCFWEADYPRAIAHTDHLATTYVRERHASITALTNHDPLVFAQHWAGSLADWIRGYPDRAVERLDEAVELARAIGHPFNLVFALTAGATCLIYLDQPDRLLAHCDEAARVVAEEALGPFSEHVNVMQWRGAAQVQRGAFEEGYALAKAGNDFWAGSEGRVCTAMFRSWIALGLNGLGRTGEAMEINRQNIAHCRETGDRYMEPECVRLQGEFALAADPADRATAERTFREAIAIARAHGALSWELRAAMSLARLLSPQAATEARSCLEPVLERFREGRTTADLREAERLLSA